MTADAVDAAAARRPSLRRRRSLRRRLPVWIGTTVALLLTLVHRRAVDRVRKVEAAGRRDGVYLRRSLAGADVDSTSATALASVEARRVRAALALLSPAQLQAVGLAYFDGLTYSQVAEVVGAPLSTVKSRIRVGLQRLRLALETVEPAT